MIRTRFLLTPLFLLMSTVSFARAEDGAVIYKRLLKSTVWVVNPVSQGSGVVIHQSTGGKTPFYLIATNHHVVDLPRSTTPDRTYPTVDVYHPRWNGGRLETDRKVYIRNGWKKRATIVHSDPKRDLAILYVSGKLDAPYSVVDISKDSATPGATVHSIGNPGSSAALWVYSDGKVRTSYKAAVRYKNGQLVNATFLVTTSPVNPGDSGGPLVDGNGRLVGINQGHQTNKRLMSYAIDRSELADYHKQLDNDGFFLATKPEHFQNRIAYYRKVGRSAEALSNYSLLLKHYKTLHAKKPSSTLAKDIADVEKQIALLKRSPGSIPGGTITPGTKPGTTPTVPKTIMASLIRFQNKSEASVGVAMILTTQKWDENKSQWQQHRMNARVSLKPGQAGYLKDSRGNLLQAQRFTLTATYLTGMKKGKVIPKDDFRISRSLRKVGDKTFSTITVVIPEDSNGGGRFNPPPVNRPRG